MPEEERLPEGGQALAWELFESSLFPLQERGPEGLTRRNDASQPRLHPAAPQRNCLLGKTRACAPS